MNKKLLHEAIDKEIDWNKTHPLIEGYTEDFRAGFIAGLVQANRIINKLSTPPQSEETIEGGKC